MHLGFLGVHVGHLFFFSALKCVKLPKRRVSSGTPLFLIILLRSSLALPKSKIVITNDN